MRLSFIVISGALAITSCGGGDNVEPPVPTSQIVVAGGGQEAPAGTALPIALGVEVRDQRSQPMPGIPVEFQVTQGGGRVSPSIVTTNVDGQAFTAWTLGPGVGINRVRATAPALSPVEFSAVATDQAPPTLTVVSPNGSVFDNNQDGRVDFVLTYADAGTGVDANTLSVTADRSLGGGTQNGGLEAGAELAGLFDQVTSTDASWSAGLDVEFPQGGHSVRVSIADIAGNFTQRTVNFTVSGTDPEIVFTSPLQGQLVSGISGFSLDLDLTDRGGRVDVSTLSLSSSQPVGGVYDPLSRRVSPTLPGGVDLIPFFDQVSAQAALFLVPDSLGFSGGQHTLSASVSDLAGNTITRFLTFEVPPAPVRVFLPDTVVVSGALIFDVVMGSSQVAGLLAIDGRMTYDSTIMTPSAWSLPADMDGFIGIVNFATPGEIRFALAAAQPVSGAPRLLTVTFTKLAGGETVLGLPELSLNEGGLAVLVFPGRVVLP